MSNQKLPPATRTDKVYAALRGDDEFSVFSVDPEANKPKVNLAANDTVNAVATPLSRSILRLFRKVFGQ